MLAFMRKCVLDKKLITLTKSPYQQIEQSLREKINTGIWAKGTMVPGRRKLAQEYGVALSTVQRAIATLLSDGTLTTVGNLGTFVANGNHTINSQSAGQYSNTASMPFINKETRGLSDIAAAYNTPINFNPTNSIHIGVLLGETTLVSGSLENEEPSPYYGGLFEGIRSTLTRENVYMSFLFRDGRSYAEIARQSSCNGMIIIAPTHLEIAQLRDLAAKDIPFVAISTSSSTEAGDKDLPCVDTDNYGGTVEAIEHLLNLGHEKIAIVDLALSNTNHFTRFDAYIDIMGKNQKSIDPNHVLVYGGLWSEPVFEPKIEQWVQKLIDLNRLPTAIFTADITMTLKTLSVLKRYSLHVPEDISIVGFDDTPIAAHVSPPLTLVQQPIYQLGRRAATRLIEHLKTSSGRLYGTELLPTKLIIRKSTICPR